MKKLLFIAICWACSLAVFAQDAQQPSASSGSPELKTIFGNGKGTCKIPMGYFIELNGGYTQFDNKSVFLPGISVGMILDHHWTVGATGSFIGNWGGVRYNDIYYDSAAQQMHGADLKGGYGGLLLEYTLFPNSRVHVAFPLMIGGGYMFYSNDQHHHDSAFYDPHNGRHGDHISSDNFFVIEPGVKVEFNIIKYMRVGLGVTYRYSPDVDLKNTPENIINQFTGRLSLRFGKF
jgi:hypothetical protein